MKKEELIHLHMLLAQFKEYCEEICVDSEFSRYEELGIAPSNVRQSKKEHKGAIFALASELAALAIKRKIQKERQ